MKAPQPDRSPPLEIELKLALPSSGQAAFVKWMARYRQPPLRQVIVTRYFDTPDGALGARGIAVRVRQIGRRRLQTFKTEGERQGGLSQRIEYEMPVRGDRPDWSLFPAAVRDRVPAAERARLVPLFETHFVRTAWTVRGRGRTRIEIALDSGDLRAGARREALCEIELELKAGEPDALFDWALRCARRIDCLPFDPSKAERGMRLALQRPLAPVRASPPVLLKSMTVQGGCVTIVQACLSQFQANLPGVLDGRDPEFLHQARVALRRLRVALHLFRSVCVPPQPLRDGLKALDAALGPARDWDVLCDDILPAIAPHFADEAVWHAGKARVDARRAAMHAGLRDTLAALRPGAWLLDFQIWLRQQPQHLPAGDDEAGAARRSRKPLKAWARDALNRRHGRLIHDADDARSADARKAHAYRIAIKRQRYALEFFGALADADGPPACLATLQALQACLGEVNDRRQAQRLLAEAGDDFGDLGPFALGWLVARDAAPKKKDVLARHLKHLVRTKTCW